MNYVLEFLYELIRMELTLIILLFLSEIKFYDKLDWFYMEIVTHPKAYKWFHIFGDSLYMVGGSVVGSGLYEYINNQKILTGVLIFGTIMIILGSYIKEKVNKKGF